MRNKKRMLFLGTLFAGLFLVGCQLFSGPGYTAPDGTVVPPTTGLIDQGAAVAGAAGAAGVPWAGLVGTVLSIAGAAGTWWQRKDKKKTLKSAVEFFDELKPLVAEMTDERDLEEFLLKQKDKNKFGQAAYKAWLEVRGWKAKK